jgi:hypothetical protein
MQLVITEQSGVITNVMSFLLFYIIYIVIYRVN